MSIAWVIQFCVVSYWELKVGVALYFGNQSPWSSTNEKGIDSLVAWLIPIRYILDVQVVDVF